MTDRTEAHEAAEDSETGEQDREEQHGISELREDLPVYSSDRHQKRDPCRSIAL